MSRHGNGRFLDYLIRLGVRQPRLDSEIAHQLAINPTKLLPSLGIIASLEPIQQAGSRLNRAMLVLGIAVIIPLKRPMTANLTKQMTKRDRARLCNLNPFGGRLD